MSPTPAIPEALDDAGGEGTIEFFNGYFPALPAGSYDLQLTHTLEVGQGGSPPAPYTLTQSIVVQGPQFAIDPNVVLQRYPPPNSSQPYGDVLPFVVLSDPSLPWERPLSDAAWSAVPWMALLVLTDDQIVAPPITGIGADPVATTTVQALLQDDVDPDPGVIGPDIDVDDLAPGVAGSACSTVTVSGSAFAAVVPSLTDLFFLAHCRQTADVPGQTGRLSAVLVGNRLPVCDGSTPVRYHIHLVSLEGFSSYLGGTALPLKPGGQAPVDVQLVSLTHWTFLSQQEEQESFAALVNGLVESEATTGGSLQLPVAASTPEPALGRLTDGYVPLEFATLTGEKTFAWYRGPFTAAPAQPLPCVGAPPVPVPLAGQAEALMIYLSEQGVFDLSYSAAWTLGRQLALADQRFAQALRRFISKAVGTVAVLAQRMALPHLAGLSPRDRLRAGASRSRFRAAIADGMGQRWLEATRSPQTAGPTAGLRLRRRSRPTVKPAALWSRPDVADAVQGHLADDISTLADWLADLVSLRPVPFSHLVPDPRMLPVEAIRFFYVDPGWLEALFAGAISIGVQTSADAGAAVAMHPLMWTALGARLRTPGARAAAAVDASPGFAAAGVLLRTQLMADYPTTAATAVAADGSPLLPVRDDVLAPGVRLILWGDVPSAFTLSEPYVGLRMGVEPSQGATGATGTTGATGATGATGVVDPIGSIYPRYVTSGSIGAPVVPEQPVGISQHLKADGSTIDVTGLVTALQAAVGLNPFDSSTILNWCDGSTVTPLTTTLVSSAQVTAELPAVYLATPGAFGITLTQTVAGIQASSEQMPFTVLASAGSTAAAAGGAAIAADAPSLAIAALAPQQAVAGGSKDLTLTCSNFTSADFAIQVVLAPEKQVFPSGATGATGATGAAAGRLGAGAAGPKGGGIR